MEKLIELLNEYENRDDDQQIEWRMGEWDKWENGKVRWIVNDVYMGWVSELVIYSSYYGFIKWLVENDKIDLDAYKTVYSGDLDKRKTLTMSSGWDEFYQVTEHWVYESLLMLLAISDTPIDFLCDIIKN